MNDDKAVIPINHQMVKFNADVKRILEAADERRKTSGEYISLSKTWDELRAYKDPNAMIMDMLVELRLLMNDHFARSLRDLSKSDEKLMEMLEDPEVDDMKWAAAHERFNKQRRENLKVAKDLSNTAVRLAHEYNQYQQQSRYMFHIKEVLQVRMVMMAVISNTLHDQGHVNSLCDALDDAFDKLYPVSSKHQAAKKA